MNTSRKKRSPLTSPIVVALIISLMLHQVFLLTVGEVWKVPTPPPDKPQEVVLLEMEAPKEPKPKIEIPPLPEPEKPAPKPTVEPEAPRPTPPIPEPVPEQSPPTATTDPTEPPSETTPQPLTSEHSQEELASVNLDLNWKSFDQTFAEEASKAREAHMEKSLDKRRGKGTYAAMSGKVKRALERNRGWARPGNQEPLGNRRQIFYRYIKMIHEERIHPIFGHGFWESLSSLGSAHELNDMSLHTLAEFEILQNGTVSEVRVVRTSGSMVFDAAAVDSVYRGSPFPAPPKEILSWNGRVYLKWGFYRSRRMCGVFNVEPYILKAPGSQKEEVPIDEFIQPTQPGPLPAS